MASGVNELFSHQFTRVAHPQMRELICPLLKELQSKIPVVFDDIYTFWPADDQTRKGSMVKNNAAENV